MSAGSPVGKRSSYFRELDSRLVQSRPALIVRSLLTVGLGLLLLVAARSVVELALVLVCILLLLGGAQRLISVLMGWTLPNLRPMTRALALFELGVAGLILLRPVAAVSLIAALVSLLVIVRGVLILLTIWDMEAYSARQRLWMLASAVISIGLGLVLLPRSPDDLLSFSRLLGLYITLIGVEQLVRSGQREERSRAIGAAVDTIMSHELSREERFTAGPDPTIGPYKTASIQNVIAHKPLPPRQMSSRSFGAHIDVSKYQRPLIISPHPDDLEGFTGGLVYSLRAPVISVIMSGGDRGRWQEEYERMSPEQFMEVRLDEATDAAQMLGIERILWMGYRDKEIQYSEASITRILNILHYLQPDMVASFEFRRSLCYYPHSDHIHTGHIVREALRRYAAEGHTPDYFLTSTLAPNRFLDVSGIRRIKLEALACHTTQDALNVIIFPFFEQMASAVWGAFNGVQYAEGYRRVAVRDLETRRPPPPVA